MPRIDLSLSLGSILTILTMLVSLTLGYAKINSTIDDMTLLRSMDMKRVEKVENITDKLQTRIEKIENQNIEFKIDIQYIKAGVTEIQAVLKQKSSK